MLTSTGFTDDIIEDRFSSDFETNLRNEFLLRDKHTTAENLDNPPRSEGEQFIGTSNFGRPTKVEDEQLEETCNFNRPTKAEDERFNKTVSFDSPVKVEDDQFNETSTHNYSDGYAPVLHSGRKKIPLGASASDLAVYSSDVLPIGERETPIGKGLSTESINSYKEKWHTPPHSGNMVEFDGKCEISEKRREEKLSKHQRRQKPGKQTRKSKHKIENRSEEQEPSEKQHKSAKQRKGQQGRFSQSAQLVQQQLVVANKLRALSAKGSYAAENLDSRSDSRSREDVFPSETIPDSKEKHQVSVFYLRLSKEMKYLRV